MNTQNAHEIQTANGNIEPMIQFKSKQNSTSEIQTCHWAKRFDSIFRQLEFEILVYNSIYLFNVVLFIRPLSTKLLSSLKLSKSTPKINTSAKNLSKTWIPRPERMFGCLLNSIFHPRYTIEAPTFHTLIEYEKGIY